MTTTTKQLKCSEATNFKPRVDGIGMVSLWFLNYISRKLKCGSKIRARDSITLMSSWRWQSPGICVDGTLSGFMIYFGIIPAFSQQVKVFCMGGKQICCSKWDAMVSICLPPSTLQGDDQEERAC